MGVTTIDTGGRRIYQVIDLVRLRLDGGTQPRVEIDAETREEYCLRMCTEPGEGGVIVDAEGVMFAPIVVFDDGEERWLADGFHRVEAARQLGIERFQAELRRGTQREAVLYSLGANARHGKRRTNADKRRAVERALSDEDWSKLSDSRLAELCCVSQPFVSKIRRELVEQGELDEQDVRRGADGKLYRVTNIGGHSSGRAQQTSSSCEACSGSDDGASHCEARSSDGARRTVSSLDRAALGRERVAILLVRALARNDWYDIATQGVGLLEEGGVLVVPQTRDLSFAVSHLIRERIEYIGATVLPGPRIFQVWSMSSHEVPPESSSLDELLRELSYPGAAILEYQPEPT